MQQTLLLSTFFALVFYFTFMEWYRHRSSIRGEVIGLRPFMEGLEREAGYIVTVRLLRNGRVVEANAEPCSACMGGFAVGDEVHLIRNRHHYTVHLSLIKNTKSCSSNCKSGIHA